MSDSHSANHPAFLHHFDSMEQQREASTLGMWLFLVTEIMFFGGAFTAYIIYRNLYPQAFAGASNSLDLNLGAINTAVLICSSLTMAMAVYGAQTGKKGMLVGFLFLTIIFGTIFLGIKGVEYHDKFTHHHVPGPNFHFEGAQGQNAQLFFSIYFALTGMHAVHMIVGMVILIVLTVQSIKNKFSPEYHAPIELFGLYWHFVDVAWIFIFPLLYLIGRR